MPQTSNTSCKACPSGTYSSAKGVSSLNECNKCAAGKKNPHKGSASSTNCTDCAANTTSKDEGSSTCVSCGAGQTAAEGSAKCDRTPCKTGTFNNIDTGTCSECPHGWTSEELDATGCTQCSLGTTTLASAGGSSVCLGCDPGFHGDATKPGQCSRCQPGLFQNIKGQTSCSTCPVGKTPNNESTACENPPWGTCEIGQEYLIDLTHSCAVGISTSYCCGTQRHL